MIKMDERQPRHRPDGGAGPGQVEQGGGHAQVRAGPLQRPGELAEAAAVHLRAVHHRHGVGPEAVHGRGHAVHPAAHGDAGDIGRAAPPARHAGGHDVQAVRAVPAQCSDHFGHRAGRPDHDGPAGAHPEAPPVVEALAEPVPGEHVQRGQGGQGEDHVSARQVQFRRVGKDGDTCGQAHARPQDAMELLGPGAHDAAVVSPGQCHGAPPQQGQAGRQHHVHIGRVDARVVADLVRRHPGQQGAGHVHGDRQREIAADPDGRSRGGPQRVGRLRQPAATDDSRPRHIHPDTPLALPNPAVFTSHTSEGGRLFTQRS